MNSLSGKWIGKYVYGRGYEHEPTSEAGNANLKLYLSKAVTG
jgi:hypothetical protein